MSYIGLGTSGNVNQCVVFYQRLSECIRRENIPNKMCATEGSDFLECWNKRKQLALNYKIQQELHKHQILELPSYDRETDQFVSRYQQPVDANKVFAAEH